MKIQVVWTGGVVLASEDVDQVREMFGVEP
jgi:hypothetical protein